VIEGTHVEAHTGNYSDWRRRVHQQERAEQERAQQERTEKERARPAKPAEPPAPRAPAQAAATREADKNRERERRRLARRVETLEADVSKLEAELAGVRAQLAGDHAGDWQKLHTLADRERELDALLTRRMAEWEAATAAVLNQADTNTD
jgi:predicted RNase H-like nuclease (RuvC/YqgF family)